MIQVQRGDMPDGFVERSIAWMDGYHARVQQNAGLTISKYWGIVRDKIGPDAEILKAAFHHKCAFCESMVEDVAHLHLEHYRPKNLVQFRNLTFDWNNWLIACPACNTAKGRKFPDCNGVPCFIDPTNEEPTEFLEFVGYRLLERNGNRRAKETIEKLKLNRAELESARSLFLAWVDALLLLFLNPDLRPQARQFLIWFMQVDAPYTAMVRAYLSAKVPRLANPPHPHPHVHFANAIEEMRQFVQTNHHLLQNLE